jgi:predicted small lipoprotein YifL
MPTLYVQAEADTDSSMSPTSPTSRPSASALDADRSSPTRRRAAFGMIALIAPLLLLAACGRRGRLERPEDADPKSPRTYPSE